MKELAFVVIFTALLAGCTTFDTVAPQSPEAEQALRFEAPLNGAALYVYRDRASHFGIFEMIMDVDDHEVSLAPACLKRIELSPGTYHLNANHPDVLGGEQEIDLTLAEGDVRVLEFKPISRFVIPGESKLIPRANEELKAIANGQALCVQSTTKL